MPFRQMCANLTATWAVCQAWEENGFIVHRAADADQGRIIMNIINKGQLLVAKSKIGRREST
jgi:hypothetical protein